MEDFLIATLYDYNRVMTENYLLHSWGKKPEQKKAEKKYNHWYYEKFKDRWKTKYNKGQSRSIGSSSKVVPSGKSGSLEGPAYDYTTTSSTEPHKDKQRSTATKLTNALQIGAKALIGGGAIALGAKIVGAGMLAAAASPVAAGLAIAAGVGVTGYGALKAISAGSRVAKAIAAEIRNASYDKHREKEPIDPKSGFHMKDQNLSPEEDIKRCNPKNQNFDSGTKNNCVLCSVTYDLRRRGLDVEAKEADTGYQVRDIDRWYDGAEKWKIGNTKDGKTMSQEALYENIETFKNIPEKANSSGIIVVTWGSTGSGHAMHYEVKNGELIISDPQTGKIYNNYKKVLKKCSEVSMIDLTNATPKYDQIRKECCV